MQQNNAERRTLNAERQTDRWTFRIRRSTLAAVETRGLLIVGHGSTVNADSSAPTWMHAREIERRGLFAEVRSAFWKEEPSMRDALLFFRDPEIREVYVVPNFISEGYFTQTVIPRELQLDGAATQRASGQLWNYCEPVGNNERVTELLLRRAEEVAPGIEPADAALLIVGHGTELNDNSAIAAKREVGKIRSLGRFAEVLNVYMEEPPLVADWVRLTIAPNVIVVPFFIADGLHSYEDIPRLLGMEVGESPQQLHGRSLFYSTAIGTAPEFADLILAQIDAFARRNRRSHSLAQPSAA